MEAAASSNFRRTGLHHCSVVEVGGIGIAIMGQPGCGKTSLAFGLVEAARRAQKDAAFVADDQAMLSRRKGALWAEAVASIAGRAELRGLGIVDVAHRPLTRLGLIVRLVADEMVPRMPAPQTEILLGVTLPQLQLPRRHEAQCVRIVMAWLAGARPARG